MPIITVADLAKTYAMGDVEVTCSGDAHIVAAERLERDTEDHEHGHFRPRSSLCRLRGDSQAAAVSVSA